jgi:alpha-glucosidase
VDLGKYIGDDGHFSMIFDFSHIDLDLGEDGMWYRKKEWTISDFKAAIMKGQLVTEDAGWGSIYLENHDQPRCLNKYLKEEHISDKSAKMLAGFYFFLKGTPFIYQGQELGMTNVRYDSIENYDDISSIDQYYSALKEGYSNEDALEALYRRSRDNSRTPMQWSSNENAGFTSGKPWLKVNPNFVDINVDIALTHKDSIYYFYKKLIQLRKNSIYSEVLTYGRFEPILQQHQSVIAYLRVLGNEKILVVADFGGKGAEIKLDFSVKKCIASNINTPAVYNDVTTASTDSSMACIDATTACTDSSTVCTDSFTAHIDKLVLAPYDFFVYEV